MHRILVCGGRDFGDKDLLYRTLDAAAIYAGRDAVMIIHGACPTGADDLAEQWAKSRQVPYWGFPAMWRRDGLAGGPIRNKRMRDLTMPTDVFAFPGDRGTRGMVRLMMETDAKIHLVGWSL